MGSPGHAFIAHTKAFSPPAQTKDGGYGLPPHPSVVRVGQRYWSRGSRGSTFRVREIRRSGVYVQREAAGRARSIITEARLLERRADGQGRHYQFQGFAPRRYDTFAYVSTVEAGEVVLYLPEWHPARPVRLPLRLLPQAARTAGARLKLTCDLSASSAARLAPDRLTAAAGTG